MAATNWAIWRGMVPDGRDPVVIRRAFQHIFKALEQLNNTIAIANVDEGDQIVLNTAKLSTDNAVPRFVGTDGIHIENTSVIITDTNGIEAASMTLSGLTASRLVATNSGKTLASVSNLASWVAGTANRVTVTNDGDGSITLSSPQDIHTGASPTFAGMTLSGLTASRLVSTNGSSVLASVADLSSWVAGTSNQITITNDTDGTITISTPQDIHTGASPTFAGMTLSGLTASRLAATGASSQLASVANLASWIAGTANQITVTDDTDGTVTLSTPQDIHTGANPTFANLTLSGDLLVNGLNIGITADADLLTLAENLLTVSGDIAIADGRWIGLGSAKGRLTFTDADTDLLTFSDCNVRIDALTASKLVLTDADKNLVSGGTAPQGEAGAANNFLTAFDATTGVFSKAQPTVANLNTAALTASKLVVTDADKLLVSGNTTPQGEAGAANNFLTAFAAATGVFSKARPTWADVDKTTSSIADITTKSHTALSDIGTLTHATLDGYLDQAVKIASSPTFVGLTLSGDLLVDGLNIGITADPDLLTLAASSLDVSGCVTATLTDAGVLTFPLAIKNSSATATTAAGLLFITTTSAYGKGAVAYVRTTTYGRGDMYFMNDVVEDTGNASLADAVMIIRNAGGTELSGNLQVNGTNIGIAADTDLLGLAADALTVNGALAATGTLASGVNDTTFGSLLLYGSSGNSGAHIYFYNPANYDTTYDYWKIDSDWGSLYFRRGSTDVFHLTQTGDAVFAGDLLVAGDVGIGTTTPDQLLQVNSAAVGGPSQFMVTSNEAGGVSILVYGVDSAGIAFDAEYNSGWKSTDAGSNFAIYKITDLLEFRYDSGIAVGAAITWNIGMVMNALGRVGIGTTGPLCPLNVAGADATGLECIRIDQADVSEGFINFVGSERGAISATTSSAKSVRVELNGTKYRLALYADA